MPCRKEWIKQSNFFCQNSPSEIVCPSAPRAAGRGPFGQVEGEPGGQVQGRGAGLPRGGDRRHPRDDQHDAGRRRQEPVLKTFGSLLTRSLSKE